jgi:maltose operon protein
MKLKPLATLFMALSLSACSGLPEQNFNTDLSKQTGCSTLEALPLTTLSTPFHQRVIVDAKLPILSNAVLLSSSSASDKARPVVSYKIASDSPFALLVRSFVDNDALFAANVLVYDGNWQLVSHYSAQGFEYHPTGMRGLERIEKVITINPQLNGAQYIVLASDSSMLGQKLARQHPEQVYAESQNIIGSKQLPLVAEYLEFGVVEVTTSALSNNAVLTLLAELGPQSSQASNSHIIPNASPEALDEWEVFQSQIDTALRNNDVQRAAALANQASQQGYTQAKDYLVEQLAK